MNKEYTVTEWCPHCESEIEMTWNVEDRGYKAVSYTHLGRIAIFSRRISSGPGMKSSISRMCT